MAAAEAAAGTQSMDFIRTAPKIGAVIRGKVPATSLTYHEDGVHLFVASEDDSRLRLVDCQQGTSDRPAIKFEREGISLVEKTHHDLCVLYVGKGNKEQPLGQRYAVHYLSLHDNKILRNFRGHAGEVTDVSVSPIEDTFLTSSNDRTVRLWNLQQAGCLAQLELPSSIEGSPHACYDSTGLVFGITVPMAAEAGHLVHLYDARNYSGGPFSEMKVQQSAIEEAIKRKEIAPDLAAQLSKAEWKSMKFNNSGQQILVTAKRGLGIVLDGFEGTVNSVVVAEGSSATASQPDALAACFTPDDRTILGGNHEGTISCWDAKTGNLVRKLEGHTSRVGCVAANPKYAQIASACVNTALWIW